MDNLTKLLEQLAAKLGTTTEYLWSVLLKQAPVDATITLIQTVLVFLFGVVLWKVHSKLIKKESNETYADTLYEVYGGAAIVPMVMATAVFIITALVSFCSIDTIINGYFNPEYWALDKILSKLK